MKQRLRMAVTGSRGFIGSVFSLRATERGHYVVALDDESRGLNDIQGKIGNAYKVHDCRKGIRDAVGWPNVDVVAHFAAATGSLERPLEELRELNVEMTQHVFQDALALGAKAFLWPTTSLAIGVPDSPYVVSKEEGLAKLLEVDADARISIPLRFFNVAGAYKGLSEIRQKEVHALPLLFEAARNGTEFIVNGDDYETCDGTPSRDFVHVLDVVEYLLDLAEAKAQGRFTYGYGGQTVDVWRGSKRYAVQTHLNDNAIWLGKGHCTTVLELIKLVEQFTGKTVNHHVGPRRAYDCGSLFPWARQANQFAEVRGGLAPAWVSVRDEVEALEEHYDAIAWAEKEAEEARRELQLEALRRYDGSGVVE